MAVRAAVIAVPTNTTTDRIDWAGCLNGDTGNPVNVEGAKALTVLLAAGGTLGLAGNCRWEGSIDGVNFFTMNSEIGIPAVVNQIALLAPTMMKERPRFVRPNISAGDGTTSLVPQLIIGR